MNASSKVHVTKVSEKFSNSGQKYFNIDLTEDTGIASEAGGTYKRCWDNCYMPFSEGMESPKMLEGVNAQVVMSFYPTSRTVGEKSFTDIKCQIVKFEPCQS